LEGDGNEIKVVVDKKVRAENQQAADKYNSSTKPQVTVSEKVVTINANTQASGDHGVTTDLTITVPKKAPVTISTRHGDVTVNGREGNVDISDQHGEVTVTDINGNASFNLDHTSALISNIAGDVIVNGRVNDISVSDIKGALRLSGEFM